MHGREIHKRRFVKVEIYPVVGFHHQRGLYTGCVNLVQQAFRVLEFLGIVVFGNPPCRVIPGHDEFRHLLFQHQHRTRMFTKHIAEAHAIVEHPELYVHPGLVLRKGDGHSIVILAYRVVFSPYGSPKAVTPLVGYLFDAKSV